MVDHSPRARYRSVRQEGGMREAGLRGGRARSVLKKSPQSYAAYSFSVACLFPFEKIHAEIYTSLGYHLIKVAPEALSQRVHRIMKWIS